MDVIGYQHYQTHLYIDWDNSIPAQTNKMLRRKRYLFAQYQTHWAHLCCCNPATHLNTVMKMWTILLASQFMLAGSFIPWNTSQCPKGCHCLHKAHFNLTLKTTDCANSHLSLVPADISLDTEAIILARNNIKPEDVSNFPGIQGLLVLDLSKNNFYTLENCKIVVPSLKYLVLEYDELDYLNDWIFSGVLHIQYLSVAYNKIEIIHEGAFSSLHQLLTLVMSHNRIFAINPGWFQDLESLTTLDLQGNNLHVLWNDGFRYLSKLETLILSDNRLNHVYDGAFVGLLELRNLFMDGNHLKSVPSAALQYFPSIQLLDLRGNFFRKLEENSFLSVNVSIIKMSNIKEMVIVDRHAFVMLPSLVELDMSNNRNLLFLHPEAFQNVPSLQKLHLHNCSLMTLQDEVVFSLPALSYLNLQSNKGITCDCTWKWLFNGVPDYMPQTANASLSNHPEALNALQPRFHSTHLSLRNHRGLTIAGLSDLYCHSPKELNEVRFTSFLLSGNVSTVCQPNIVPLLPHDLRIVLGESMVMPCLAFGNPPPRIYWILPNPCNHRFDSDKSQTSGISMSSVNSGPVASTDLPSVKEVNMSIQQCRLNPGSQLDSTGRIRVSDAGTLLIDYAAGSDSGIYTCMGENIAGKSKHIIDIHVQTVVANVIIVHVSESSVTVTWKTTVYDQTFQLFYRRHQSNGTYSIVDLRPYMRSYTGNATFLWTMFFSTKSAKLSSLKFKSTKRKDLAVYG